MTVANFYTALAIVAGFGIFCLGLYLWDRWEWQKFIRDLLEKRGNWL